MEGPPWAGVRARSELAAGPQGGVAQQQDGSGQGKAGVALQLPDRGLQDRRSLCQGSQAD